MQTPGASGIATPDQRFVSENKDVEDRLKAQTVGLVQASDFRKRTAEAMAGSNSSDTKKPSPYVLSIRHEVRTNSTSAEMPRPNARRNARRPRADFPLPLMTTKKTTHRIKIYLAD